MRFDIFDLRLFVATAEAGNLTRASRLMNIVPAAASARIKHLEEIFAVSLFQRESSGVRLTPAGHSMLFHARRILVQCNRMRDDLSEFTKGLKGIVRIYSISIGVTEYLPRVLVEFLAKHPNVSVEIEEHLSDEVIQAVRDLNVDIGIIGGTFEISDLIVYPYRREQLVVLTPRDHPLSRGKQISLEEAVDHDFVSFSEGNTLNALLARRANAIGKSFKIRARVKGAYEIGRMVESNVGISIMEESAARRCATVSDVHLVPLSDAWSLREVAICIRGLDSLSESARDLVHLLRRSE